MSGVDFKIDGIDRVENSLKTILISSISRMEKTVKTPFVSRKDKAVDSQKSVNKVNEKLKEK